MRHNNTACNFPKKDLYHPMNSKSYIYMLIRDFQHNKTPIKYSVKKSLFFRALARGSLTTEFLENSAIQ